MVNWWRVSTLWNLVVKFWFLTQNDEFEWGFYALSASKAIFRARSYSHNLFSPVMIITWWMKLGGNRPPGDNPLLFSISGTGSFICPITQTRLDIPRPLITQSWGTGRKAEVFSSASGTRTDNASSLSPTRYPLSQLPPPPHPKKNVLLFSRQTSSMKHHLTETQEHDFEIYNIV